jgi:hypothetical protein
MRLCKFILIAFLLSMTTILPAKAQNPYIPKIIPPSPNEATLMKFVDVPVSTYTGTASVTVPVHTIQAKGLTVPISLDYHTGGIKLKEEAGWVGLGWALKAGGSISRSIMDEDDFGQNKTYFTNVVPQLSGDILGQDNGLINSFNTGDYFRAFYCNYLVRTTSGLMDYAYPFSFYNTPYDMEPDIFQYNFLDKSGSFIITRDRKVVLRKQDNIQITFDNNGNSFTIKDEKGNSYYFNETQYTMSATGALSTLATSSWFLTKIVTQQQDSVMLHYYNDNTWTYVGPEYTHTYSTYCGGTGYSVSNTAGTQYTNKTLQTIDFGDGQLQFTFDNIRSDTRESRKLNSIKVYAKKDGGLSYLKQFNLYYSYFNTPLYDTLEYNRLRLDSVKELSGTVSLPPYAFSYNIPQNQTFLLGKHSTSIDHWGYFNGVSNHTLIPKTNIFYNPPHAGDQNPHSGYFEYSGGNRQASESYMKAFSLREIKYPTGGKTVLDYEANDYDPDRSRNGPVDFQHVELETVQKQVAVWNRGTSTGTIDLSLIHPIIAESAPGTNLEMIVAFRSSNNDGNAHYRNSFGKIWFKLMGPGYNLLEDIGSSNLNCDPNSPVCWVTLPLKISNRNGPYTWEAFIDPTVDIAYFQDIRVTFQFQAIKSLEDQQNGNYTATAGGLRIKTIADYSDENTIAKKRVYDYNYYDGNSRYSYGRLMSPPSYTRYILNGNGIGNMFCETLSLMGSSNTALTSVAQGNIVGYDQVTEYTVNPVDNRDIGKTVYNYVNVPDRTQQYWGFRLPGLLNEGNNLNGSLVSKKLFSNTPDGYRPVSETYNYYRTANRLIYYSLKYQHPPTGGGGIPGNQCTSGNSVSNPILACLYPSINSDRILLDSTKEVLYDQSMYGPLLTTVNRNYFDNPVHYQPTRTEIIDSKQSRITTFIKYPQDYIPSGNTLTGNTILDGLISRNAVAEIIEKSNVLYPPGSSSGSVTGAQLNKHKLLSSGMIGLDKQYDLHVPSPVTDFQAYTINGNATAQDSRYQQMISFDQYDNANNIAQFTPLGEGPVSVIWDYGKRYPVCEVKNAVMSDIAYTSFEADGDGGWTIGGASRINGGVTGRKCYHLSYGAISKTGLSTGTEYIVSYWTSNSNPWFIAGTQGVPFQGRTVGGWTYFEHRITGVSQVVIPNIVGLIDELRLYPRDARMTTYTHEPLLGMSSSCSADNKVLIYEYDNLGRLKVVKDQEGNVIKTFEYHYQGQP